MRRALVGLILGMVALSPERTCFGANKYMRPGGSGSFSGNDWNNAIGGGFNFSNGDTIWMAGGNYGPLFWDNHSSVTLKRATANNPQCTGAAGWNVSFDSQVVITASTQINGYAIHSQNCPGFTVDGQIPGGIKIVLPIAPNDGTPGRGNYNTSQIQPYQGFDGYGNNTVLQYIDFAGAVVPTSDYGIVYGNNNTTTTNLLVRYIRSIGCNTHLFFNNIDSAIVEYCEFGQSYGNQFNHDNVAFINFCNNGIWRYNYTHDFGALGVFFSGTFPPGSDNWKLYSSIFANPSSSGTGILFDNAGSPPYHLGPNWFVYNNTFSRLAISIRTPDRNNPNGSSVTGGFVRNNIFYQASPQFGAMIFNNNWYSSASAYSAGDPAGVLGTGVDPFNNLGAGDYHIKSIIASDYPRAKGAPLAAEYSIDYDGVSFANPPSIGAYEFPTGSPGNPGVIQFVNAAVTVSEAAGSVNLTVRRTGGSSGSVSVDFATQSGSATQGANYTMTTATVSWGNGITSDQNVNVPLVNTAMIGSKSFSGILSNPSGGALLGQSSEVVTLTGTGTTPACLLAGLSWQAEDACSINSPMVKGTNGSTVYIYQPVDSDDPATTGKAIFTFTNAAGAYRINSSIKAESTAVNSFFVSTNNGLPFIWDIVSLTQGFQTRYVNIRGTGSFDAPQYTNAIFQLPSGTNTITIYGREATELDSLTLEPVMISPPPVVTYLTTSVTNDLLYPAAYRKDGSNIPVTISWSLPVVVTGSPTLDTTGGPGSYISTTSSNTFWNILVGPTNNTQKLDVTAINLNGGSIQTSGVDAVLTLPASGAAGSLGAAQLIIVDNIPPVATITGPSDPITTGVDANWIISFSDANIGINPGLLSTNNVILGHTGTANATISLGGVNSTLYAGVSHFSGTGTLFISILAGGGQDAAGNLAGAVGPSTPLNVDTSQLTIIRSGSFQRVLINK